MELGVDPEPSLLPLGVGTRHLAYAAQYEEASKQQLTRLSDAWLVIAKHTGDPSPGSRRSSPRGHGHHHHKQHEPQHRHSHDWRHHDIDGDSYPAPPSVHRVVEGPPPPLYLPASSAPVQQPAYPPPRAMQGAAADYYQAGNAHSRRY